MPTASPLLDHALKQARADWLSGDASAWSRYAECVAQLEAHFRAPRKAEPQNPRLFNSRPDRLHAQA